MFRLFALVAFVFCAFLGQGVASLGASVPGEESASIQVGAENVRPRAVSDAPQRHVVDESGTTSPGGIEQEDERDRDGEADARVSTLPLRPAGWKFVVCVPEQCKHEPPHREIPTPPPRS